MTSAASSTKLPVSPTAKAFFDALDGSGGQGGGRAQSEFVSKQIRTLGWRNRHSQDEFYPISLLQQDASSSPIQFSVRQVQRGELEGTYGTGATVWPASVVLIKYLERHAEALVRNKRVIDLGAGTGVTSIAAACLGAKEVVCTDGEPNVVRLARDNIEAVSKTLGCNAAGSIQPDTEQAQQQPQFLIQSTPVHVQEYWWGRDAIQGGNECDLVIVSDCVLPKLYPIAPLVDALDQLLSGNNNNNPNAVAVVSYEHRHYPEYDPREKFIELATSKSLVVTMVPTEEQHEVYSVDDIEIWHVQRAAASD